MPISIDSNNQNLQPADSKFKRELSYARDYILMFKLAMFCLIDR